MPTSETFRSLDPSELSQSQQYRLLAGAVVPRPIAFVVTKGSVGLNAAPFSFFNLVSTDPPMLIISVAPRRGMEKDTIRNLHECPEFVVHIVSNDLAARMNECAASLPPDVSEVELAGFSVAPSLKIAPPRLIEFPMQLECRVAQILSLGSRPHAAVIGEIVHIHAREGIIGADFTIDSDKLDAIGRISGQGRYVRLTDTFFMQQPD